MKQLEKLDLILKFLYEKKFDGYYYDLPEILLDYGIEVNLDEGFALGKRLERDGLVKAIEAKSGMSVTLTTEGIDYIENDSYSNHGHSVISNHYNISITDSINTSIVQNSTNTTISQATSLADEIINKILNELSKDNISSVQFEDIKDCLTEIKTAIASGINPKYSFKTLLTMTSEFSSIGSLILSLGQLIGQH